MNAVAAPQLKDSFSQGLALTPHALFPSQDGKEGEKDIPKKRTVYTLLPSI